MSFSMSVVLPLPDQPAKPKIFMPGAFYRPAAALLSDHHVGSLDDRVGAVAALELQLAHRFHRDGRRDDRATRELDLDVGGRDALLHREDLALQDVPCAEPHFASPGLNPCFARIACPSGER